MYYTWQNYTSDDNSAIIGAKTRVVKNSGGEMISLVTSYEVKGYVYGTGQQDVSDSMNELESALARPYSNFLFYQDDGAVSATALYNGPSLSGVTVTDGPNWLLDARGANYVRQNEYTFTVSAEYPLSNTRNMLLSFEERIIRSGGGPRYMLQECLYGPPQRQRIRAATIFSTVQEGSAEGYLRQPRIPPALWPAHLMFAPDTMEASPDREGKGFKRYAISWKYTYMSPVYLPGPPNLWPS